MAWDKGVPGLVARAYHRVKCVRARSMTRSRCRFFASRHSLPSRKLHQSFAAAALRRPSEQIFAPLSNDRSFHIHLAERRLMAT
jgi:hypothetical protein